MLFDLEDYKNMGFIGPDSATNDVNTLSWEDAYTMHRATRDAWFKVINEYYISGIVVNPLSSREAIHAAYTDVYTKYTEFNNSESPSFWAAMLSLNPSVTDESSFVSTYPTYTNLHYTVFSTGIYNAYKVKMESLLLSLKNLTIVIDGSTYKEFV
jgi:hypothetical protein